MKVLLWCWDARMTWDDEPSNIQTKMADAEKRFLYTKRPESYLTGFRRLVDYCAAHGIWGIVIWGFLRDSHGGIAAAKDLCNYASDKGVAILPGVGLCSYGGYYYEGDHPFNIDTYLRIHPERGSMAIVEGQNREVRPVLDPSLAANQRWWRDGLEWMLDTGRICVFVQVHARPAETAGSIPIPETASTKTDSPGWRRRSPPFCTKTEMRPNVATREISIDFAVRGD
jgi:hypothetical protein